MKKTLVRMPAGHAGEAELNQLLGERSAFSRVADSCSAADAACLRRMRDEKMYRFKKVNWSRFCAEYLGISKAEADRIIRRFEEFGQSYFDVSRIVRISPESYRAIAHAVKDKTIEHNGERIALTSENAQRVTAAVQALRQAAAPKRIEPARRIPICERVSALQRRAYEITAELREVCQEADRGGCDRQTIQRLARDLRQRMYDLEVLAA